MISLHSSSLMLGRYTHFGSRHKPGKTFVAFDPVERFASFFAIHGFRRIISASADGKLRVYTNKDDLSPQEFVVGEKVNFIICKVYWPSLCTISRENMLSWRQRAHMSICSR